MLSRARSLAAILPRDVAEGHSHALVVAANNLLSYGFLGAIALVSSRFLGPSGRGAVVLFTTTASFTLLISCLGTNVAARVRLVSSSDPLSIGDYLGLTLILTGLDIVICATLGFTVLGISGAVVTPWVLPLLLAHALVYLPAYLGQFGLAAFGYNNAATRSEVIYGSSQLVLLLALHLTIGLTVNGFLVIVVGTTLLELMYVCYRLRAHGLLVAPTFDRKAMRLHVRRSLPALALTFFEAGVFKMDRLVVGILLAPAAVGVYSVAGTLSDLAMLVPVSLAQVLFSSVAQGRGTVRLFRRVQQVNFGATALAGAVLFFGVPPVIHRILGSAFDGAVSPMRILLLSGLAVAGYRLNITAVAASGHLATASVATAVGCGVDIVLCFVLVPFLGIDGAALASLIAYAVMATIAWRSRRRYCRWSLTDERSRVVVNT